MSAASPSDARRQFAHNAAAGGVVNIAKIAIQLAMLPVMARLLGPSEYGLYALAAPTISFFTVLADGGLGMSMAREDERSTAVWSTAFWVTLAICTTIAVGVTAGGFVLGAASDQPRLAGIMGFLSTSFILLALTILPAARLVRRGNLVLHSVGDFVSTIIGTAIALGLALGGAGAWALAAQYVTGFAVRAVILNRAAFCLPTWEFDLAGFWPHVATGGSVIGSRLSEFAGRLAENFLFGGVFGPAALGTYSFANQTSRFLCEAASNPLWGALYSHAISQDARTLEPLHNRLSRLLATVLFPAVSLLSAAAPQVIAFALGPKWVDAAGLLRILVPAYALTVVAGQNGAIMLANGRNAVLFWISAGLSVGRVLAAAAGPWVGPEGVAWGVDAANLLYAAAMFGAIGPTTNADVWPLLRGLVAPLLASGVAAVACYAILVIYPEGLLWTLIAIGAGGLAYLACIFALEGRQLMSDVTSIVRIARPARG